MSTCAIPELIVDPVDESASSLVGLNPIPPGTPKPLPDHVTRHLIGGTSALGLGVVIERGTGFLANILAARFGGASTFGAYSLAISTANNISTYAAGGIGATAARFSGKYPYGGTHYATFARALSIVSLFSAALAAAALWFGAVPIAHLLGQQALTGLLRWAAVSASGIILLECARGFFVGQRRLAALVLLSLIVGFGMLLLLPIAAHMHSPIRMIMVQGTITTAAVVVCLLLARPLTLLSPAKTSGKVRLGPMLREIWSFGFIQLAGLVCSNLAGWWLMTLVARADTSLVQMSFFAIASQLRNLAGIAPGLLTEGSYAVMADPDGETARTPHRVMALCSYASVSIALLLAAVGIVVMPWALTALYGHAYQAASVTTAVGLAIAVVHMGNAPAAARLSIVSIRATGVINTIWAIVVASSASVFLFHGGTAFQAMSIYFGAHVLSAALVLLTLKRKDHVPSGMIAMFSLTALSSGSLAALAFLRSTYPSLAMPLTAAMAAQLALSITSVVFFGKRYHWLPSRTAVQGLTARFGRRPRHV